MNDKPTIARSLAWQASIGELRQRMTAYACQELRGIVANVNGEYTSSAVEAARRELASRPAVPKSDDTDEHLGAPPPRNEHSHNLTEPRSTLQPPTMHWRLRNLLAILLALPASILMLLAIVAIVTQGFVVGLTAAVVAAALLWGAILMRSVQPVVLYLRRFGDSTRRFDGWIANGLPADFRVVALSDPASNLVPRTGPEFAGCLLMSLALPASGLIIVILYALVVTVFPAAWSVLAKIPDDELGALFGWGAISVFIVIAYLTDRLELRMQRVLGHRVAAVVNNATDLASLAGRAFRWRTTQFLTIFLAGPSKLSVCVRSCGRKLC
jgi:hypothetical protein